MKLNASELRHLDGSQKVSTPAKAPLYLILENVYDTYNVGGLFRLADALNVSRLYLCGEMLKEPNHKVHKASVGTHRVVPWAYKKSAAEAIAELKNEAKVQIVAIEQDRTSVPYSQAVYDESVALIVGNESFGVLPETLKLADVIVEIPMWGINKSLNVIVSAAVVSYWIATGSKVHKLGR